MRALLILLILSLQAVLGWFIYKDYTTCCKSNEPVLSEIKKVSLPIEFSWSSSLPVTNDGWAGIRDSLLEQMEENQKLEITGLYCKEEDGSEVSDTLAKMRASKTRLLFPQLSDEKVILTTRLVDCKTLSKTENFNALSFGLRTITENIVETADETLIYFPPNSTKKLDSEEVEAYLDKIVARVKKSDEKITLVGHTDDTGPEDLNIKLGLSRAMIIKRYLIDQGLPENTIEVSSEGESNPLADNKTEAGKAKNRRTALKIIR